MNRDQLYNPGEEIVETDRLLMRRLRPDDYMAMSAWDAMYDKSALQWNIVSQNIF